MATSVTTYGGWVGNYRLRMTFDRVSVNVSANTSTVRSRVWLESRNGASFFGYSSIHNQTIRGAIVLNGYTTVRAIDPNSSTLVMDNQRTVLHDSNGNLSVGSDANFRNDIVSIVSVDAVLALDRIDQLPDAPASAPTVSTSGLTVTATSAVPDANGGSITGYRFAWRPVGGTWSYVTSSSRTTSWTVSGGSIEVQSQGSTARGYGPYSTSRTVVVGTVPDQIAAVTITRRTRGLTGSWSAPGNGGIAISRYDVQFWDGRSWGDVESIGTARTYTASDLLPGTAQKIRARAVNSIGAGPWRESVATIPSGCSCAT